MRRVVRHAPGDVRVEDREDPRIIEPTDAVIRLSATCTCGSDLWPDRGVEPVDHTLMGHEHVGVVEEAGDAVQTLKPGDFVMSDNTCEICQAEFQSECVHADAAQAGPGETAARAARAGSRGLPGHGPANRHQGRAHRLMPMPLTRTMLAAVPTGILTALLGAGCDAGGDTSDDQVAADPASTAHSTPTPAPSRSPVGNAAGEPAESEDNRMDIQVTIGDQTFTATLQDSPAAHDLLAQLPVTVEMTDHGGVEKTGPLPRPLSLEGQPEGADPDVGDVGYYAPGDDLVLYYGDQSYFPGIVVLGRMEADSAGRIANMDGSVTATVEAR